MHFYSLLCHYLWVLPCRLNNLLHSKVQRRVWLFPPCPAWEYCSPHPVDPRYQGLVIGSEVFLRALQEIAFIVYFTLFCPGELFRIHIIPFLKPCNYPLLARTIVMDADPEKHPEERLQIMHK